jgi:hypothetical protein
MWDKFSSAVVETINNLLGPFFHALFDPINQALGPVYMPWARIFALAYFFGTMIWVYIGLKREYVNLEAPSGHLWHDLRFWTVISMLPHVIVYFNF